MVMPKMLLKVGSLAAAAVLIFSGCTSAQGTFTISDATESELDASLVQGGDLPGWSFEGVAGSPSQADIQATKDRYAKSGDLLCDTAPRQGPEYTSPDGKHYVTSGAERICGDVAEFARNNTESFTSKAELEDALGSGVRVLEFSAAEVRVSDALPNLVWGESVSIVTAYRIDALFSVPEGTVRMDRLEVSLYSSKVVSTIFFESYDAQVDQDMATRVTAAVSRRMRT